MYWLGLFSRTWSQGLQAFVPIAACLIWFSRRDAAITRAIRWGLAVSFPATVGAAWVFRRSATQALDEALLGWMATLLATLFVVHVWREQAHETGTPSPRHPRLLLGALMTSAVVIVVRQTMEIGAVWEVAALDLRSFPATVTIVLATAASAGVAGVCRWSGSRLPPRESRLAVKACAIVFVLQLLTYSLHETAEAKLLPWSDVFHLASEPYGPDGVYGVHLSELLVVVPLAAALWGLSRRRRARQPWVLGAVLIAALWWSSARPLEAGQAGQEQYLATGLPRLLFRDTTPGPAFGTLSVAPLDAPERGRATTGLLCDRISFAAGHGVCAHPVRGLFGLFTSQQAVFLDDKLKPTGVPVDLDGKPSRSRVAQDGRVGAVTVFVLGEDYGAAFSTRTTLFDMSSGRGLGDLEQFTTWRDGRRVRAADYNFWGVTFMRDGNQFYASLRTDGATYLVRGDVSARSLTIVRENVECPSVSPDNRTLAFKKHVGPDSRAWRLTVLDLTTLTDRFVSSETRYIDDQVEWLDATHVLYAVRRPTTSSSDVWVAPIDGDAPPRIFLREAESPIVVR